MATRRRTARELAASRLALVLGSERPLAFSARGWREKPGVAIRACAPAATSHDVEAALERVRPHVVHANTLLSLPEAAVARSCGLPVVLQVHELPARGPKTTATIRYAAGIADVLVAVSDAVAQLLRRHAGRTPVLTVRNGVSEAPGRARPTVAPFTVGTVATVSRTKGTDVFMRAARLALEERPELRFEHVGAPDLHRDSGLDAELAQRSAEMAPEGALSMLGYRPAAEVVPRWNVFVCPSRSEAFPLATLEAMAIGIPVVATMVGGIPEQIDHLETGVLVRPDDPEAIASWLVRLHDEPELRARLGEPAPSACGASSRSSGRRRACIERICWRSTDDLRRPRAPNEGGRWMTAPRISAVVVAWNSGEALGQCLDSLRASARAGGRAARSSSWSTTAPTDHAVDELGLEPQTS